MAIGGVSRRGNPSRGPTLTTLRQIEGILRQAQGPLSLNEIKRRMTARAVRHATVRAVVEEFKRLGLAVEGPEGIQWRGTGREADSPRKTRPRRPPALDALGGSLAGYGAYEDWIRDLDRSREAGH